MKYKITIFAVLAFFLPAVTFAFTPISGTLSSNATWTAANSPYVISLFGFTVPAGVTLTLEPGTVVKFTQNNTPITIKGTLLANGTSENPVYFTSFRDDSVGGDTNSDATTTVPSDGEWSTLNVQMGAVVNLNYTVLRYGGYFGTTISNGGTLAVSHSTIEHSLHYGIIHSGGTTTVTDTTFEHIGQYGFSTPSAGTGTATLTNNIFSHNLAPGYFNLGNGAIVNHSGNVAIENQRNGFFVQMSRTNAASQTWNADGIPYIISVLGVTVPAGKTLSLEPGVIIKFEQYNVGFGVSGALDVHGTLENPVYFTNLSNDTVGGDTDFSGPTPYSYAWGGITMYPDSVVALKGAFLTNGTTGIINGGGALSVSGSEISHSTSYGIAHSFGTTTVSQSSIHDNASYGVYNSTTNTINAESNWWGDVLGPRHPTNPSGIGDRVSDSVDFTPWLGYDPTITTPLALSNPTETEDDGNQDGKGVADKTNFTFSVMATGTPDTINLVAVSETGTTTLPLTFTQGSPVYSATSTFPKGHYAWHVEATAGGQTVQTPDQVFTTGYSNVAFLPGIKASRLFKQGTGFEDQLWEPNWSTDTEDIALNPDGSSVDTDIYTKTDPNEGLIDQANILPLPGILSENFYVSFIESMDKMVENKEIAKWKSLPYDWRLAFPQILRGGNATVSGKIFYDDRYATNTPYILQELRALAKTSDTGKVTIVAHSMGGLLAKKLLRDYADIASFTDTLILVDSPQLGTPQAIATMLHGTNEDVPVNNFGLFTNAKTGRKVAQNMPSVYTLLPSREYAIRVTDENQTYSTLISQDATLRGIAGDPLFSANSVLDYYNLNYGTTTITTYNALKDFLGGRDGHLSAPDDDIIHPTRIQMDMLAEAQAIHDEIDNWTPPAGMRVVQIAGWGIPETIRGVNYKGKAVSAPCPPPFTGSCKKTIFDTEPLFTFDGDGTVVVPSQTAMNTETYFVDLNSHNEGPTKDRTHGGVLEVENVRTLIENINQNKINPAQTLTFIKTDKNQLQQGDLKKLVRLSLHSPVKVDVSDQDGNHLGISASSTAIKTVYDTQMSNSYYLEMGEGKYLGFPLSATTTIQLQGTGAGTFTLNLEQFQGDTKEGTQTFTDIPVSTSTKAMLVINTLSDAKELALDQNGDGVADSIVFTDENKETITFQTLKDEIRTLPEKTNKELLEKAVSAEKQFGKGNYKSAKKKLMKLKKEIAELAQMKEKKKSRIENTEALRISAIIDTLVAQTETKIQENKHEDEGKKKDGGKEDEDGD